MSGISREEALWAELVDEAGEELIEQAASVSVAQAEADLRAAGFDVAEERARAEVFLRSLGGEATAAPAPAKKPNAKRRRPVVAWAAAAAAAAVGAAAVYVETRPPMVAHPAPPASDDVEAAADLRHRAAVACDAGHPAECLSLLDQARDRDPAGDTAPEVARLRAKAERDLRGGTPGR
jgi:hypothetical protein